MAMIDALNKFSDAQAITATAASTNYMDLLAARDIAIGRPLYVVVKCVTAMTDASSNSTVAVTVETDDNTGFSSATTAQTIGTFSAVSAAGTKFVVPLAQFTTAERYMQLKYTVANGDLSTGSFTAYLTDAPEQEKVYANGYTIS